MSLRLFWAGVLAIGCHGLLLMVDIHGRGSCPATHRALQPMALSLAVRPAETPSVGLPLQTVPVPKSVVLPAPLRKNATSLPAPPKSARSVSRPPAQMALVEKQKAGGISDAPPVPLDREAMATHDETTDAGSSESRTLALPEETVAAYTTIPVQQNTKPPLREAAPLYLKNEPPAYPLLARRRRLQGTVVLSVRVARNGRVDDIGIDESSGHAVLDAAAVASVRRWLFEPESMGGRPIDTWVRIPVSFRLK
ncbi:MAG: energy transducer TonB [Pseudomonadota bacterium]